MNYNHNNPLDCTISLDCSVNSPPYSSDAAALHTHENNQPQQQPLLPFVNIPEYKSPSLPTNSQNDKLYNSLKKNSLKRMLIDGGIDCDDDNNATPLSLSAQHPSYSDIVQEDSNNSIKLENFSAAASTTNSGGSNGRYIENGLTKTQIHTLMSMSPIYNSVNIGKTRLQEFYKNKFSQPILFFSQWDIEMWIYSLTDLLCKAIHTCFYISANTYTTTIAPPQTNKDSAAENCKKEASPQSLHSKTSANYNSSSGNKNAATPAASMNTKYRIQCDIGLCKNPKKWVAIKNIRQRQIQRRGYGSSGAAAATSKNPSSSLLKPKKKIAAATSKTKRCGGAPSASSAAALLKKNLANENMTSSASLPQLGYNKKKWRILCYCVIPVSDYYSSENGGSGGIGGGGGANLSFDSIKEKVTQISKIKGLDNRIKALIAFSIRNYLPLRINKNLITKNSPWYMPNVKDFIIRNNIISGEKLSSKSSGGGSGGGII